MSRKKRVEKIEPALTPYDWQMADINKALASMNQEVGALIASDPGAGKTLVTTEILKGLDVKCVLIIAPQGTHKSAWLRTLKRQGFADEVHLLVGTPKGKKNLGRLRWGEPGVYITTPQWFARQKWAGIKPDAVVYDEIHMATAYGSAGQKKLFELGDVKYRIGLSGTPVRNKFENAWSLVKWIEPAKIQLDFWAWRVSACLTEYDRFAPQNRRVIGERVPGALFNSLTCYIQHRHREKCCDFHPEGFLAGLEEPLRIERLIDMTPAQSKFYREIENALATDILNEAGDEVRINAEMLLTARGMLRFCAIALPTVDAETNKLKLSEDSPSPKLDALIEDLPSFEGKHTLVLTHSKQAANLAVHRLKRAGYSVEGWTGDVTKTRRDDILTRFRGGELEIIVGVISAMGVGLDQLQEVCNNLVWLSVDDDASNNTQAIARLDRIGQQKRVISREYISSKTLDEGFLGAKLAKVMELERSTHRRV